MQSILIAQGKPCLLPAQVIVERRSSPRVSTPFQATVCGVDASGRAFRARTNIDNLSAGGLYLRLEYQLMKGSKLYIIVHIAVTAIDRQRQPQWITYSKVLRTEPKTGGTHGFGVKFIHRRFI